MRSMLLRSCLLALAVAAVLAAPAGAAGPWRDAGPAVRPLAADGGVVAFAVRHGGPVRLRDGAGRVLGDVAAPPACTFAGAGGGDLLWTCPAAGLVVDRRTGERSVLPPAPSGDPSGSASYEAIGARWVAARAVGHHSTTVRYVDRVTGAVVTAPAGETRRVPDLDLPALWRTLCRPAEVREAPAASGLRLEPGPYAYRPPYGAALSFAETADGIQGPRLVLDRCGRRSRTLSRCPRGCTDPRAGAHAVVWTERDAVRVHLLRRRRTDRFALRGAEDVAVVGHRVYAVAGGRLKTLALPR